jgi:DNA-binding beta-propeller fold protein YncE
MEVDAETNELYIADGYGNHRVLVVDAETGQYKRHWGAYGANPVDDAAADALGDYGADRDAGVTPQYFRNPVHCVRITDDRRVYVCDRVNNRLQEFKTDGTFIREAFIRPETLGSGSVWDLDTSSDERQSCLHNPDGTNQQVDNLSRRSLKVLSSFGRNGRYAGEFHWVHNVATDSDGNIYTAEVDTGKRAQKFTRVGDQVGCRGG